MSYKHIDNDILNEAGRPGVQLKLALVSVPVLLYCCFVSSILIAKVSDDMKIDVDISNREYAMHLIEELSKEESVTIHYVVTRGHHTSNTELLEQQAKVDETMSKMIEIHFKSGKAEHELHDIKELGIFMKILKRVLLLELRSIAEHSENSDRFKVATNLVGGYATIIRGISLISGRQASFSMSKHGRATLSLLGCMRKLLSWSSIQASSIWFDHDHNTESMIALSDSEAYFWNADIIHRSYTTATNMRRTDLIEFSDTNMAAQEVMSALRQSYETHYHFSTNVIERCGHHADEMEHAALVFSKWMVESENHSKGEMERELILLVVLLCIGVIGTALHALNVVSSSARESDRLGILKEHGKLLEAGARMQEFVSGVSKNDDSYHMNKPKGIPYIESSFYDVYPRIKAVRAMMTGAMGSSKFRDPTKVFGDFHLAPIEADVTFMVCNFGQFNKDSPEQGVTVKQKAIEASVNKYISGIEQEIDDSRAYTLDVTADQITLCWNLFHTFESSAAAAKVACEVALRLIKRMRNDDVTPSIGIAAGKVAAGIVGVSVLKKFITVGPVLPLARHLEKLARFYELACIIDSQSVEPPSRQEVLVRPIDYVSIEMGDHAKENILINELSNNDQKQKSKDDTPERQWKQMFTAYQEGNINSAKEQLKQHAGKYGSSALTQRFGILCTSYPEVPCRNIYDFVEKEN